MCILVGHQSEMVYTRHSGHKDWDYKDLLKREKVIIKCTVGLYALWHSESVGVCTCASVAIMCVCHNIIME